jgi:hypothetical protein
LWNEQAKLVFKNLVSILTKNNNANNICFTNYKDKLSEEKKKRFFVIREFMFAIKSGQLGLLGSNV